MASSTTTTKGTNVGATVAALEGLRKGGADRRRDGEGQDFAPQGRLARYARAVVLIGRDALAIEAARWSVAAWP